MAVTEPTRKKLIHVAYLFAGTLFFVWGGLGWYWEKKLPREPNGLTGRVYPVHFEGAYIYANAIEITLVYALPFAAIIIGLLINWVDRHTGNKK